MAAGSASYDRYGIVPGELVKLVVEVNVSSQARDLGLRLRAHATAGVPQCWMVDPRPEAGYPLRHTAPSDGTDAEGRRFTVGAAAVLAG